MFAKKSRIAFVRHSEILSQKGVDLGGGFVVYTISSFSVCNPNSDRAGWVSSVFSLLQEKLGNCRRTQVLAPQ